MKHFKLKLLIGLETMDYASAQIISKELLNEIERYKRTHKGILYIKTEKTEDKGGINGNPRNYKQP